MLYGIKDCANLKVFSNETQNLRLWANYARTSDLTFESEAVYAHNKTTRAIRWDGERTGTFTTTFEVFNMDVVAMLFGTELESATTDWCKCAVLPVVSGVATLPETPKTGSLKVYLTDSSGTIVGVEQTEGEPTTAPNTYSLSEQTLTLNSTTTFAEDGYVLVTYMLETQTNSFIVNSAKFPGGYHLYGDTFIRDTLQNDTAVQFELPNIKPQSNVTLSMNVENVTTLSVTWDILADANGDQLLWHQAAE